MMAVMKSDSGTWEVQCWYRDCFGKRHKKHKRGFASKAEASKWEREFMLKAEGSPQMTFSDFVKVYESDKKPQLKLNTWLTKKAIIVKKILPFFGSKKLDEITAQDLITWQNALAKAVIPSTGKPYAKTYIRTVTNQLSAILNHDVKYYGLAKSPYAMVDKVKKAKPLNVDFWTKDEYLKFADAIMDKPLAFTAFEVLYFTGIREGELLALTPSDFDFGKNLLRITRSYQRIHGEDVITDPKTSKSIRTIAVPDFVIDEVGEFVALEGIKSDERMFKVTKSYLYREMRRGCAVSDVKVIRIHDIRRSHVSLLIDLGFIALAIADRMGHEAVDVTYRYADLFPNVQADMARALENLEGR